MWDQHLDYSWWLGLKSWWLQYRRKVKGHVVWASFQIRKIAGCACAGNAGNVFPPPRVSNTDMHHGTCVTHVPWCLPGSLTSGFLWSRGRGKRSRHSWRMRNPQFYVYGKRPMGSMFSTVIWLIIIVNCDHREKYQEVKKFPGKQIFCNTLVTLLSYVCTVAMNWSCLYFQHTVCPFCGFFCVVVRTV